MIGLSALACLTIVGNASAAGPAETAPVVDLDRGSFRAYLRWKTPTLVTAEGRIVPLRELPRRGQTEADRKPAPVVAAALPPAAWTQADFDDTNWPRARGAVVVPQGAWGYGIPADKGLFYARGNQVDWQLVCLRGLFRVTDPSQVKDLKLTVRYHGGAVVYLNGQEVARGHLPQGRIEPDALADAYPAEADFRPDGTSYTKGDQTRFAERLSARIRTLPSKDAPDAVVIPTALLRKGLNVLAVEVHAAPVDERTIVAVTNQETPWPHVGALEVRLAAAASAGLIANVGPSDAVELWNCQPLETEETWDYAHPSDGIRPIRLVGARNGSFSGKVVLSAKGPIRGITAAVSDLTAAVGAIPASAVQVRYAEPATPKVSWNRPERFDRLLSEFPAELAPVKITPRDRTKAGPAPATVVPVWVTVRVPAEAAAGAYRGILTLNAAAAAPATFTVPLELTVHDWKVPNALDFASHHNVYQSPDTVAQYYQVPLWSDRHFELMARSFEVLRDVASKVCVLSLIVKTPTLNNTESMVRWVKKADGGYEYDFTIVEKYLDLYGQTAGKPAVLQLNLWTHVGANDKNPPPPYSVSVLDPATGKIEPMAQPPYGTPENEAFWRPVLTELRQRLEKRGWFDVTAVCYTSYCWFPSKEMVGVYQNIWPDGKWMNTSHGNPQSYAGPNGTMPVPYSEWVWGCGRLYDPDVDKGTPGQYAFYPRPWKLGAGRIETGIPRVGVGFINVLRDQSALAVYRMATEGVMQSNVRGLGRVGGDFWPLPIGRGGQLAPLCDSYAAVGMTNNTVAMISPGPDGAIFNERLEMFREGVQIAEAIIFVQRALDTNQIGGDLAKRVNDLLDERARYYLRMRFPHDACRLAFESSAWQERDGQLFALAAEVAGTRKP